MMMTQLKLDATKIITLTIDCTPVLVSSTFIELALLALDITFNQEPDIRQFLEDDHDYQHWEFQMFSG